MQKKMENNKFAENLRRIKKVRHISTEALAEKVFLSPRQIDKYVKGETIPRYSMAKQIADSLNVSLSEMCEYNLTKVESQGLRDFILCGMEKCGISNCEMFSVELGLNHLAISRILNGKTDPKITTVIEIAERFKEYSSETFNRNDIVKGICMCLENKCFACPYNGSGCINEMLSECLTLILHSRIERDRPFEIKCKDGGYWYSKSAKSEKEAVCEYAKIYGDTAQSAFFCHCDMWDCTQLIAEFNNNCAKKDGEKIVGICQL